MITDYKKKFQEWKEKKEEQGFKFYDEVSEVGVDSRLKKGDRVMFTNDYGVTFGPHEVMAFCEPENGRCVYIDYDCYWFPARPGNLVPEQEYYNSSLERLTDVAEGLDWKVVIDDDNIELSRYTSRGQDFSFSIPKDSIHVNELYEYYDAYDPAENAMYWVDSNGHGKNGAPDRLQDILDDMEEAKDCLKTLYDTLKNFNKCGN